MATGPGDELEAAGRGHLRASHADREHAIEVLKAAYVQGMLTNDELDARVGQALTSRTCAGLAALTADLPAEPPAARLERPPAPARRRPLARAAGKSGICLIITAAAIGGGDLLDPGDAGPGPPQFWVAMMILLAVVSLWTAVGIMGVAVVTSLDQRYSRRQLPPRPGPDGHALDGEPHGGTGQGPAPGPRTSQAHAGLQARKPRQHRQYTSPQASRASRGARPAPGAV